MKQTDDLTRSHLAARRSQHQLTFARVRVVVGCFLSHNPTGPDREFLLHG